MEPASALSYLWYDMVLLVCPTRSTDCWTEFSESSMVECASSSGAVVAFSRACHSSSVVSKVDTDVCLFSFRKIGHPDLKW